MGNVTLPTPVFVASGALCILAGYLAGSVLSSDPPQNTRATVVSYDARTSRLCLAGDAVKDRAAADADGHLCGTWSRSIRGVVPHRGDSFRFISLDQNTVKGGGRTGVVILGTVVE